MSRPISDGWFYRIKSATRDLVQACGGVERAAAKALVSKTEVSRWQTTGEGAVIPICAALALEAECGAPLVTRAMAELHALRLADPGDEDDAAAGVILQTAEAARQAGELVAAAAGAVSDGRLTPSEAEALDRAAGELARGLEPLRQDLAQVRAGGQRADLRVVRR